MSEENTSIYKSLRFACCVSCVVCFFNRQVESTLCKLCQNGSMWIPIPATEIAVLGEAIGDEKKLMEYYTRL